MGGSPRTHSGIAPPLQHFTTLTPPSFLIFPNPHIPQSLSWQVVGGLESSVFGRAALTVMKSTLLPLLIDTQDLQKFLVMDRHAINSPAMVADLPHRTLLAWGRQVRDGAWTSACRLLNE